MKRACLVSLVAIAAAIAGCGDNSPNLAPEVASSHLALSTAEDGTIAIDASAIDPEGQSMTYTISAAQHGTITGTGPRFTYTPAANFSGHETLLVTVSDGVNTVDVTVDLTVSAVNDAPVVEDKQTTTLENQALAIALVGTDVDTAVLSYSLDRPPVHGTLMGTLPFLTYTPDWHYFGGDSFTFEAFDGALSSNVATVTISVVDVIACGDGVVEGVEQCDDGNDDNTDACLTTCVAATCGDGFVELGVEQCDDGNQNNNDACRNNCTYNPCHLAAGDPSITACADEPTR